MFMDQLNFLPSRYQGIWYNRKITSLLEKYLFKEKPNIVKLLQTVSKTFNIVLSEFFLDSSIWLHIELCPLPALPADHLRNLYL